MKITSFTPQILTSHFDEVVKVFEALGFQKKHNPTGTSGTGSQFEGAWMEDANGFHVDVTSSTRMPEKDITAIRMNVDDYDQAHEWLLSQGFKSATGEKATETKSVKADLLVAPSGFGISLVEHKK